MRTGIVIDSACDLPQSFLDAHHIHLLPILLCRGETRLPDQRDPEATLAFYRQYQADKTLDADTAPPTVADIQARLLDELALQYDRVLVITITQTRSPLFAHATEAAYAVLKQSREPACHQRRVQAGLTGPLFVTVIDSQALFTGQGVLVHEAIRLLEAEQLSFSVLRKVIEQLSPRVQGYLVPDDLFYVRHRSSRKGEKSIGLLSYHFGTLLDIKPIIHFHQGESQVIDKDRGFDRALIKLFNRTREAMTAGLATPLVNCSYAGDLDTIRRKAAFVELEEYAQRHGITVLLSMMSVTGSLNVGPGAFALSYIDGPPLVLPTVNEAEEALSVSLHPEPPDWAI